MRTIAFSNATEYEIWAAQWCERCKLFDGCGILLAVMERNAIPAQWIERGLGNYECGAFDPSKDWS